MTSITGTAAPGVNQNIRTKRRPVWPLRLFCLLLAPIGVWLTLGGAYLVSLGGSPYYPVTGLLVCICAVFLWRADRRGLNLFGIMVAFTVVWSIVVSDFRFWVLLPRLVGPYVLWLLLLAPWVQGRLHPAASKAQRTAAAIGVLAVPLILLAAAWTEFGTQEHGPMPGSTGLSDRMAGGMPAGDWQSYGRSTGGTRYSPLSSITPQNVDKLEPAWTFRLGAVPPAPVPLLEVTPLKVDDTLYACRADMRIFALDAESGKERWHFDPKTDTKGRLLVTCRGVSYYRDPAASADRICAARILFGTADSRLMALDAATGRPCADFGNKGTVDLNSGLGKTALSYHVITSPPAIARGNAIVGGFVLDNQMTGEPSGVVRAFNAVTGKLAWAWDLGRADTDPSLKPGETYTAGTPNVWAPIAVDESLGMVYLPTGNATPDFWNSHRSPAMRKYSSSVVAVDSTTGRARWSFQTTHEDVWDYDVPAQPTLADFPVGGKIVPALIQPTKRGEIFVLDRRTGKPILPVQERPVTTRSNVGLVLSPTQPYSIAVPSLAGPDLTESSMWGLTPLDELWCRIRFKTSIYTGQFTPPSTDAFIQYPGYAGGSNWGGVSVDPDRLVVVANVTRLANRGRLVPRAEADRRGFKPFSGLRADGPQGEAALTRPQRGTPYGVDFEPFLSPLGVPCQQPPFGTITAIDLRNSKVLWSRPLGTARDSGPMGIASHVPLPFGTPNLGGSVITRSGLVFIGATQERVLRAFSLATGKLLWHANLPFTANATPMLYRSRSGREFVVVAAGGNINLGTPSGDHLVAFALPDARKAVPRRR